MIFRRRNLPPETVRVLAAFDRVADEVQLAKTALTDALPGARMPGRPLHGALAEFEWRLTEALAAMPGWRVHVVADRWEACETALVTSLDRAAGAREEAPELPGFEALLALLQELLEPLEVFEGAESRVWVLARGGARGQGVLGPG